LFFTKPYHTPPEHLGTCHMGSLLSAII